MLVIDDFNELVGLETLFRRLGFDVLSLGRESHVQEAILGFPPDLVIATGLGRHVDGLRLAPKLRYGSHGQPLLVVLLPHQEGTSSVGEHSALSYADVDAVIETPFDPHSALKVVARLLNLETEPLLQKYAKIVTARLFEPDELKILKHPREVTRLIHVTANDAAERPVIPAPPVKKEISAREERYAKFLDDKAEEELPPMASAAAMRDARKKLEASEAAAPIEDLQRAALLAREKREFVRAMIEASKAEISTQNESGTGGKSES